MKSKINIITVMLLVGAVLAGGGCKRTKTIPDDTLSDIFRDMYIVNAYAERDMNNVVFDSINIYEPILNNYGYTSRDFINTVGGFSKRKSAKLSNIVEDAYNKLDKEYAVYSTRVALLDRIDSIALEESKEVIFVYDTLITAKKVADTSRLHISIPVKDDGKGKYVVTYKYKVDSSESNAGLQGRHYLLDSVGRNVRNATQSLRKTYKWEKAENTLEANARAEKLELLFGNYPKTLKDKLDLSVDSIKVVKYTDVETARTKLLRSHLDYKLVVKDREYLIYYDMPADSATMDITPPEAIPDSILTVLRDPNASPPAGKSEDVPGEVDTDSPEIQ